MKPIHLRLISRRPSDGVGAKVAKDLPAGGKDDDGTEHDVEQRLGTVLRDMPKEERPEDHSGDATEQHP